MAQSGFMCILRLPHHISASSVQRFLCAFAVLIVGFASAHAAIAATTRALLIGVSDYPVASVGTELQLSGPKYDVALMLETLEASGVPDTTITVLADGLELTGSKRKSDGLPTKAAIMAALTTLERTAQRSDLVLIYLSGHGSQEPETTSKKSKDPEADGLNEIFLPLDIGKWNDGIAAVDNALVDDELGEAVQAIRAKGAFVWLVVDACHSGTLTRSGGNGDDVTKKVDPVALGIPQALLDQAKNLAEARAPATRSGGGGPIIRDEQPLVSTAAMIGDGGFVAFYAAHPDELALQRSLPRGYDDIENKRPHGVLTFYVAQALRSGGLSTYRQLAYRVLAGYEQIGSDSPVPLFEGDLDTGLFGGKGGPKGLYDVVRNGDTVTVAAGVVDGVTPETVFALSIVGEETPPFAYVKAGPVGLSDTSTAFTEFNGTPEASPSSWPDYGVIVASVVSRGIPLTLRVAKPKPSAKPSAAETAIIEAIEAMATPQSGSTALSLLLLPSGSKDADITLWFAEGALWFIPDNGAFSTSGRNKTPSLDLSVITDATMARRALEDRLGRVAKARNLIRATSQLSGADAPSKLTVKAYLWRPTFEPLADSARAPDDRRCPDAPSDSIPQGAVSFDSLAPGGLDAVELTHCDRVYFEISNAGPKPVDVTPLYVDGGAGIEYLGPYDGLRIQPNEQARVIGLNIVTFSVRSGNPLPTGLERMVFIAVERPDRSALPADFSYLAQASLGASTRSAGATSALQNLLNDAAFGAATRSASAPAGDGKGTASAFTFQWRVNPPSEVEGRQPN